LQVREVNIICEAFGDLLHCRQRKGENRMNEIISIAVRELGIEDCTTVKPPDDFGSIIVVGRSPKVAQGRIPAAHLLDLRRVKAILADLAESAEMPVIRS
jgi:hypothetical protein